MLYELDALHRLQGVHVGVQGRQQHAAEIPADLRGWNQNTWDSPEDLSGRTLEVIKVYRNGAAEHKDHEIDGFAFIKRHCLHCVDPSCVSVCPVGAMRKDPATGVVTHNADACIGCRYCVYSCPFGVPQYDFDNPLGKIAKCQFCSHLQKEGKIPACCDVCPTGASLFGSVKDLDKEIERRLAAPVGSTYTFARGKLGDDRPPNVATIPSYVKGVLRRTRERRHPSALPRRCAVRKTRAAQRRAAARRRARRRDARRRSTTG